MPRITDDFPLFFLLRMNWQNFFPFWSEGICPQFKYNEKM